MLVHACYENYVFDIEKLQRASPDMSEQFNQPCAHRKRETLVYILWPVHLCQNFRAKSKVDGLGSKWTF